MNRRSVSLVFLVVGAGAIGLGFYMQAQLNAKNAGLSFARMQTSGSPAPWVVGIGGAVLMLIGLILYLNLSSDSAAPPDQPDDRVPASPQAALEELERLRDAGLISPEEFAAKRAEILGRL